MPGVVFLKDKIRDLAKDLETEKNKLIIMKI